MAKMHPSNVLDFNNATERRFYNELKNQLPDEYDVYYSVMWYDKENGEKVNSEADFVVVHPIKGFLCIEVKGGANIIHENDKYKILDSNGNTIYEKNISPYEQADKSLRYFMNLYMETYGERFDGIYGFMVAFPNFNIKNNVEQLFFQTPDTTIDCNDMNNLKNTIDSAYTYWGGKFNRISEITITDSRKRLCDMFKRIYAIEASKGALIEAKNKELEHINKVQDNIINLLGNYKNFAIKGAAGTGKSWIAYKMALASAVQKSKKTLLISKSDILSEYFNNQNNIEGYLI